MGVDINAVGPAQKTALECAMQCSPEFVRLLLAKGAEVDVKSREGNTPLMAAARSGKTEMTRLLLDNGADVNARNNYGQTALMSVADTLGFLGEDVAYGSYFEVVKLLLDQGANISERGDPAGRTILMHAAQSGNLEMVKLLLEKGADVNAKNIRGETALSLARGKDIEEIEKALMAHGAKK